MLLFTVCLCMCYLCVISYGGRQQRESIFDSDSSLDDLLTQTFQTVFTVRGGQVQEACKTIHKTQGDTV